MTKSDITMLVIFIDEEMNFHEIKKLMPTIDQVDLARVYKLAYEAKAKKDKQKGLGKLSATWKKLTG